MIRPTTPGQTSRPGISEGAKAPAPGSAASRPTATPLPAAPAPAGDQLQLSPEALSLQQGGASTGSQPSELAADRMQQVLGRMADGHYDQAHVQDEVIRRIAKDL